MRKIDEFNDDLNGDGITQGQAVAAVRKNKKLLIALGIVAAVLLLIAVL